MTGLAALATTVACGGGNPPELSGLTDQVAQVGTELRIDLNATDKDGDKLDYSFKAPDVKDLQNHATITESPSGAGVFRWTPLGADVGQHAFDFTVSDGSHDTTVTINIDVKSALGSATAPVFRQPLGSGTTVDLSKKNCVDLSIVIEDQDTPNVTITQEEPKIDGAELHVEDGQTATWHWCPSHDQTAETRYTLVLGADDGNNPKTIKNYLIVLRTGDGTSCPGAAPVIMHTPQDVSTILDLAPTATISDDKGIKDQPLLYYSLSAPANPPDLSKMTQVSMLLLTGDNKSGQYTAGIPNPVATMPAGAQQTVYYVIVANDDDDTMGTCDHTTQSQVYSMKVTSTGGGANLPACAVCSHDAQCGTGDECVAMGSMGASYCLQSCAGGCPTGYTCSTTTVHSVDGADAMQCVPDSGTCEMSTSTCQDDTWEVNDSRTDASHNPVLTPDTYDLVSCPSTTSQTRANDDWFKIVLTSDQRVDLQIAGDASSDIDLHLYNSDGTVVTASTSLNPDEEINRCLKAATYYVKVNGYGHARNQYLLSYDSHAESCDTACTDDANEDDDTYSQAREAYAGYTSTGNQICPADDDWYHVRLYSNDTMTVDLTFTQSDSTQDLDLHLYKDSIDLTPCDVNNPSTCTVEHGQGATSNEHTTFTAPSTCGSGCDYYVVVRGYNNSSNAYGISIGIQ